jgi:hypothetical protein
VGTVVTKSQIKQGIKFSTKDKVRFYLINFFTMYAMSLKKQKARKTKIIEGRQ